MSSIFSEGGCYEEQFKTKSKIFHRGFFILYQFFDFSIFRKILAEYYVLKNSSEKFLGNSLEIWTSFAEKGR